MGRDSLLETLSRPIATLCFLGLFSICSLGCSFNGLRPAEDQSFSSGGDSAFQISRNSIKLLPFSVRLTKIRSLTGSAEPSLYSELMARRFELGAYDFANGVNQELTWTETRIGLWLKAIQPVCSSNILKSKFPYPASAANFIKAAYGRETNNSDLILLSKVSSSTGTDIQKFEMLCSVVLSSLEFTTL
jgi:hypothetical protein